jgi:hypothetical protein
MEAVSDFYDSSFEEEAIEKSFLESTFFQERSYSVRAAQLAQRILFLEGAISFCGGALLLPWVSGPRTVIASLMMVGVAVSASGTLVNYLFYNQVYKPHNPDTRFRLFDGPVPVRKTEKPLSEI